MFEKKRYHCVLQHDMNDCGAACLSTIALHHGIQCTVAKARQLVGTDRQGTNLYGIVEGAKKLNFKSKALEVPKDNLIHMIFPCIAHLEKEDGTFHYIVIHKIERGHLIIADPNTGIKKISLENFLNKEYCVNGYKWTSKIIVFFYTSGSNMKKKENQWLLMVRKNIVSIGVIFFSSLLYTLLNIVGTFYYKILIDDLLPSAKLKQLNVISCLFILLGLFKVLMNFVRNWLSIFLNKKLNKSIILEFYNHIIKLPLEFFTTRETGQIISRSNDAIQIREILSSVTVTILLDAIILIFAAFILLNESIKLFFIVCFFGMFYMIIIYIYSDKYKKYNERTMIENSKLTAYSIETINGIETIKTNNAEIFAQSKTEHKFNSTMKATIKLQKLICMQTFLAEIITLLGEVLILWIGGNDVINGCLTIGELITFNTLVIYFYDPLERVVNIQPQFQSAKVAAERIAEIMDLEIERKSEKNKISYKKLDGDIEFSHVNFRYGAKPLIFKNLCFKISGGEKIGIIGSSGSGKTTLVKLLLNLYEIEDGNIFINNTSINKIKLDDLREKIAYISQETFLFSGTIKENMELGRSKYSVEDIIDACGKAQANDFIEKLNKKYETELSENGKNLSGGQRQRISIARALLKQPDILILDEATSNLDAITEEMFSKNLEKYTQNMTMIFIAHRLSTVRKCDRIFVMDAGKIVEAGTHEELIKMHGIYENLLKKQGFYLNK